MMRAALLVLLLAGCAAGPGDRAKFDALMAQCRSYVAYPHYGECVEDSLDKQIPSWGSDSHAALVRLYIAWNKAAGHRVELGQMDETSARLGSDELMARLKVQAAQINAANVDRSLAIMSAGLALMQGPAMPATTTTTYSGRPFGNRVITCTQAGAAVYCN